MGIKRRAQLSRPKHTTTKIDRGGRTVLDGDSDQDLSDDRMDTETFSRPFLDSETSADDMDTEGETPGITAASENNEPGPSVLSGSRTSSHQLKPSVFKAPTSDEVRTIKEASDLFKSNSFKLQIDALLPTISPKASRLESLEKALFELHRLISQIKPVPQQAPLNAARDMLRKGVAVPYPDPPPTSNTNWQVGFEPPTSIKIAGSWGNKVSVLGKDDVGYEVDLVLEMPTSLLQEKDFVNGRFFHKRAFYLSIVAAAIQENKALPVALSYISAQGDPRRTCIHLKPQKAKSPLDFSKSHVSITILVSLPDPSPFPTSRLSPSHGNLRIALSVDPSLPAQPLHHPPSPLYNSLVLQATTPLTHLLSIHKFKSEVQAFADTLALLKVWANQRGYGKGTKRLVRGFDSIGVNAWWSFLLGYLVSGGASWNGKRGHKSIGRGLSSYQMFRAALDFLAKHDFGNEPVFMQTNSKEKFSRSEFVENHEAVFVDPTSTFNLLANVPLASLELLRQDALMTLKHMDREPESFDAVFMTDHRDPCFRFDCVLRVNLEGAISRRETPLEILELGSRSNALIHQIQQVIRQALGTRAKHSVILASSSPNRPLSQAQPAPQALIEIGITLNVEHAFRLVDHGPGADDPKAAAEFRAFWGEKAELRRFSDGRITESVVWEVANAEERAHIPLKVVEYILGHHFKIPPSNIQFVAPQYDQLLTRPPELARLYSTEPGGYRAAISAFDDLVKAIKGLENLPLSLVSVSSTSGYLRHTSVFQPTPLNTSRFASLPTCSRHLPALDIVLNFEKSAKWPDDLAAIQKLKLAFFEAIAQELLDKHIASHAKVVLDADANVIEDNCSLEIITTAGFAFRGRIYHDREETLLSRMISSQPNSEPERKRKEILKALNLHHRRFTHAPRHHAAIAALHHRCPSFSLTVRLAKRWFSSHMLLPHVPEEVVELICAHVYLNPGTLDVPGSGPTGFSRIIRLLKDWDFRLAPLFVPLYTATKSEEADLAGVRFPNEVRLQAEAGWKKAIGDATWCIVTEEDQSGVIFAKVSAVIALRAQQVAAATWTCLQTQLEEGSPSVKAMFIHPLDDYDFVIHLDPSVLPRYWLNVDAQRSEWAQSIQYQNLQGESVFGSDALVDFDPAELFFADLQKMYEGSVLFFHDPLGGTVIGGIWDPHVRQARPFRVFGGYSTQPTRSEASAKNVAVELNAMAVLAEIERMGQGLIQKIVVNS